MKLAQFACLGVALALTATPALAEGGKRYQRHEAGQDRRIEKGVESGALTPGEEKGLERRDEALDKRKEHIVSDGKVTPGEKHRLRRAEHREDRAIFRKKHNGRDG
ncbi:MAG: hypothetical protein WDO70_10820 [Alphaproteobacteria bacterium]